MNHKRDHEAYYRSKQRMAEIRPELELIKMIVVCAVFWLIIFLFGY